METGDVNHDLLLTIMCFRETGPEREMGDVNYNLSFNVFQGDGTREGDGRCEL